MPDWGSVIEHTTNVWIGSSSSAYNPHRLQKIFFGVMVQSARAEWTFTGTGNLHPHPLAVYLPLKPGFAPARCDHWFLWGPLYMASRSPVAVAEIERPR
jgi:hypothetical protein